MSRWYERANEASFKRVEEGYVFQNPNPWMLARPSYYLVNDVAKHSILLHLGRWRLMMVLLAAALPLSFMLVPAMAPKVVGSFLAPFYVALGPVVFSLLLFATAILVMAIFFAVPQIYLARSLRPLLADALRTEKRIKVAEQLPAIAASVSSTVLMVGLTGASLMIGSGGATLAHAFVEGHVARSAFAPTCLIVLGVLMVSYFVHLFRLKTKMRGAACEA